MDWLDVGNLYIMMPENRVNAWHGVASDDYDRACAAGDDWLAPLPVGDVTALVLGGDPGRVLVVTADDGQTRIIRWIYAENERDLVTFALSGEGVQRTEPDFEFDNPAEEWRLFDAAANPADGELVARSVFLTPGRVRVRTTYQEQGANAAVVHRFF